MLARAHAAQRPGRRGAVLSPCVARACLRPCRTAPSAHEALDVRWSLAGWRAPMPHSALGAAGGVALSPGACGGARRSVPTYAI